LAYRFEVTSLHDITTACLLAIQPSLQLAIAVTTHFTVSAMAKLWVKLLVTYCICFVCQLSSSTTDSTMAMEKKLSEFSKKHLVALISEVGNNNKNKHAR
jgi:hypothetical protein